MKVRKLPVKRCYFIKNGSKKLKSFLKYNTTGLN